MNFDADDSQGPDASCKTSADWDWFQFSDAVRPRFVPQSDGKYELHYLVRTFIPYVVVNSHMPRRHVKPINLRWRTFLM